jgi:hypothetical protein
VKVEQIIEYIKKEKKSHLLLRDGDGFSFCPRKEQAETRVAPKGRWLGTEESRLAALKDQARMDKLVGCGFCDLCDEVVTRLKKVR